jgi:1-acyl-sn-glycerol-3-phosphate acyltransferase
MPVIMNSESSTGVISGTLGRLEGLKKPAWLALNGLQLMVTLICSAVGIMLALLIRLLTGSARVPLRMASWFWSPFLVRGAGARVKVSGLEHLDEHEAYVVVANHQSMIDICALFMAVPKPLRFMLKSELSRVPFLGWYTRAMGMVFVNRTRRGKRACEQLDEAISLVRNGHCLGAFPEGTRSRDGEVRPFKCGPFQVAIRAGVPVVPVAISGTGQVMPPDGFHIRPGRIVVRIGKPISTAGLDIRARRQLAETTRQAIQSMLSEPAAGELDRSRDPVQ